MTGLEKMKDLCWKVRMKTKDESNNNAQQPNGGIAIPNPKRNRMKKRMTTLLHTHVALIILTICASLDASCVIGQIIADILIMKDELHEKEIMETASKDLLFKTFPKILNRTLHNSWTIQSVISEIQNHLAGSSHSHDHALDDHMHWATNFSDHHHDDHDHNHDDGPLHGADFHLHRAKRAVGGNHKHFFFNDATRHSHYMLHELTHAFHLGSMVILTLLVFVTFFKIFVMGRKFLSHKIEVFDAFVITVSWVLDVAFWEGLWAHPEDEAANIMIYILPWRVIRIVNSFVLVIQGRDLLQLKIVKQQYRGSAKKAGDLKMKVEMYRIEIRNLHSLCKKKNIPDKEIQSCAPNGAGRRRRSSLLPVLTRIASLGLASVNSNTDLLKSHPEPPTPAGSDSEDEFPPTFCGGRISRMSSTSEDFTLARTISNMSTCSVSTVVPTPRHSLASMGGEDNPVFIDDKIVETSEPLDEKQEEPDNFSTKL